MEDRLRRYWGFVVLAVTLAAWAVLILGGLTVPFVVLILIMSVGALGYFLFQAPLWCGAVTRDGKLCRNNCSGLLIGCHLREHKWQKLKMALVPKAWRELNRGLWATPREGVTTLSGLSTVVSALAAVIIIFVH